MQVKRTEYRGRKGWLLDNDALRLVVLQTGGHLASLTNREDPELDPYWKPRWEAVEPQAYRAQHEATYGSRLLASIAGHNLCLPWFGDPSDAERRLGLGLHGEAPVVRWRLTERRLGTTRIMASFSCTMPTSGLRMTRSLTLRRGGDVIRVRERVENLTRRDRPYSWCQHVTLGPPFMEKGVTVVDMPALEGHTFPGAFGQPQRLRSHSAFRWPLGPGRNGTPVNLRLLERRFRKSSDYYALHMDPRQSCAWFAALHPVRKHLLAYIWKRADFPWVGAWEENYGRKNTPWSGGELTRGLECTTSPFPDGLRAAADLGSLDGEKTLRWLPARGHARVDYAVLWRRVDQPSQGVAAIAPLAHGGFRVDPL